MSFKSLYLVAVMSLVTSNVLYAQSSALNTDTQVSAQPSSIEQTTNMPNKPTPEQIKADKKASAKDDISKVNENIRFAASVSALDLPFPLSAGISVIYQNHDKWMLEFSYMRNLFPLNTIKDVDAEELGQQHFSIKAHYFVREHFYTTVGMGKRYTKARLSDDYFNYSNYSVESAVSKFNTDYVTFGVGSVFKLNENVQLNIDWAAFNLGFSKETTQSASDVVENAYFKQSILEQEEILEQYMSNTFLRVSIMGRY